MGHQHRARSRSKNLRCFIYFKAASTCEDKMNLESFLNYVAFNKKVAL